jgi:hypothetical protein
VADVVPGRPISAEVPVLDQQVRRDDHPAVRRSDDRGVVPRSQQGGLDGSQTGGDPFDQPELAEI